MDMFKIASPAKLWTNMCSMKKTEQPEDNPYEMVYTADPKQTMTRLDKFLMDRVEKISRSKIQDGIKNGKILVNGKQIKPSYKIRPNDVVTLHLDKPRGLNERVQPEDIPIDIYYEDDDIMVVFHLKGAILPGKDDAFVDRPGIVHRIDKDTSGLLLVGKTEHALAHLSKQFFNHTVKREYYALVWGDLKDDKGTIIGNIGRNPSNRLQFKVFPEGDEGKHAVTHYEVVERMYYVTLIKCHLETGRTHQIRVHMKYANHTLFNDGRYGGDKILKGNYW